MANPVIVNAVPAIGSISKVGAPARCSLRSDSLEVIRSTVYMYQGAGPAFYDPDSMGVLPENHENITFELFALEGIQNTPATRSLFDISGEQYLQIEKTEDPPVAQEALYRFGGLQSPASPDAMLMLEFKLQLSSGDITPDGEETGVLVGLRTSNKGVVVKFRSGPEAIELWAASYATTSRPIVLGDPYRVTHNWGNGITAAYKLLWNPRADLVRLYHQYDDDNFATLLIDGAISDFGLLPEDERWEDAPWAYFGHSYAQPKGTSYWRSVYLFNIVDNPISGGVFVGDQVGSIKTDEVCEYIGNELPQDADRPWLPLPSSFGTLGGTERVDNGRLALHRNNVLESIGIYREEPRIGVGVAVFDFTFSGALNFIKSGTQNTGMEFYMDTGARVARVALLFSEGNSYVGIYTGGNANLIGSYVGTLTAWQSERTLRLKMDPAGQTTLYALSLLVEGVEEQYLTSIATASLPASEMPGPGLGVVHNANTSEARASLSIRCLRYAVGLRVMDSYPIPVEWTSTGSGTTSEEDGAITLESDSESSPFYYHLTESGGDPENGVGLEFRARVKSYSIGGEESPIRSIPGAGVIINDKTNHIALLFADAGPLGKVIFLAKTDTDYEEMLRKIRAGDESVYGAYVVVDWTSFHLYRFQRAVGGKLQLFIDNHETPSIELDEYDFDYPTSQTGVWQVRFGNLVAGALVKSQWALLQYNISNGIDLNVAPRRSENEVLSLFEHAFNNILEVEDDAP
jgi:hypothetical protein